MLRIYRFYNFVNIMGSISDAQLIIATLVNCVQTPFYFFMFLIYCIPFHLFVVLSYLVLDICLEFLLSVT